MLELDTRKINLMTKEKIEKYLAEGWSGHEFLLADGLEEAFIGVVYGKSRNPVTCYDRAHCISVLMMRDEMTEDEAEEFFSFNVDDAWIGPHTPMFLTIMDRKN